MFDRAPKGAAMISGFAPLMTSERLAGFQRDIREINTGVVDGKVDVAAYLAARATRSTPSFASRFPDFAAFSAQWGPIDSSMTTMLATIRANLGNYQAVAALPSFVLFPWFFVAPGAIVLALLALALARPARWPLICGVLVALGAGLVAAPIVFDMFDRAPKGQTMVKAFKTIETSARVDTIQGYFGEMVTGQGAVRLDLVPALEKTGLDARQIAARFPGITTLDRQWVPILNDMTPLVGAMSDNVTNYQAVANLPPFGLFPWFFVVPGLLIALLALVAEPMRRRVATAPQFDPATAQPKGAS
jgi:hypothetical protein